jgi:peptidoglycan/xylan/chitin deacetylase (PgdA/CDA1 family)
VIAATRPLDDRFTLRQCPLILMYHTVADVPEDPNQLAVAPARFAEQMAWLARAGLRGVGVGELVDAMRDGRQHRLVGITFDDGYASVLDSALPVLRRHGFGATVFAVAALLGRSNEWDEGPAWPLLDDAGITDLAAAGVEIGSHGATHVRLAGLPAAQVAAEVRDSMADLAALTGIQPRGFAYPYGSVDPAARRAVRDAGYSYACAVVTPLAQLGFTALPRIYVGQRDGAVHMRGKRLLYRPYIMKQGRRL